MMPADGRNRISVCCGCGIFFILCLGVLFLFFYWFVLPPIRWAAGCLDDTEAENAFQESLLLQQETASGLVDGAEPAEKSASGGLPPPPPPPQPPEPPEPPAEETPRQNDQPESV